MKFKGAVFWYAIAVLGIIADRITKYLINQSIELNTTKILIDKLLYLTNIRNTGAAWSILQNGRFVFIPMISIVSIVLIYIIFRAQNRVLRTSLSLILAGALGNFIDRIFEPGGGVIDFIGVYIGLYRFPIFNVADSLVCVGTIILAVYILFIYKEKEKDEEKLEVGKNS